MGICWSSLQISSHLLLTGWPWIASYAGGAWVVSACWHSRVLYSSICLLSQRILLNLWPLKMISGVEFLILITVWPRMSTFDDIFSNIHLRIFFLCLSCFSTSKFTSILDAENVKFWFPSSNPRELMVSFYKTGFFPADLGLIHLLCPLSDCCLFNSQKKDRVVN